MKTDDSSTRSSLRRPQDGAVLVVVLLAMIGLLGMGLAGLYLTSGNIQMSSNINMRNQALYVAEGGIQVAKGILNRPNSDLSYPNLSLMLSGTAGPSGATVATPSGFTDEIPGRAGTDASDPGCSGKSSNGVSTRGAYLRDDNPTPTGFGWQTSASTTPQAVYIDCNYPPTYSYTDSNGNSISYNATPPDPNGMSATPTQYMGKYTLFIRQDLGECRQGYITQDSNGIVVIRSEGTASDNRTKVVLEVTMSTNPNVQILSQAIATVCPAGAAGCDDNSSVQQGITVGPPGSGGVPGSGGSGGSGGGGGGTGGAVGCTKDSDCPSGKSCCNGACVDKTTDSNNCGVCGTKCSGSTPVCCNSACVATPGAISDKSCGPCGGVDCTKNSAQKKCCPSGTSYACVDTTADINNCGGCGATQPQDICVSPKICCSGVCNTPRDPSTYSSTHCGPCGLSCGIDACCSGVCTSSAAATANTANTKCGPCADDCTKKTPLACCAPDNSSHIGNGSYYSCITQVCPNVGVMGVEGIWSKLTSSTNPGTTDFRNWLSTYSNSCYPQVIPINTAGSITVDALKNYNVVILLDLYHSSAEHDACLKNASTLSNCLLQHGNPDYDTGHQRQFTEAEFDAIRTWVEGGVPGQIAGGHGFSTTIGYHWFSKETYNINGILKRFNLAYKTDSSGGVILGFVGGGVGVDLSVAGGSLIPSSPLPPPFDFKNTVTMLHMAAGTPITATSSSPPYVASPFRYAQGVDSDGTKYDIGYYVDNIGSQSVKGRINVWADEWITYDEVWAGGGNRLYQTQYYWENVVQWIGQCP